MVGVAAATPTKKPAKKKKAAFKPDTSDAPGPWHRVKLVLGVWTYGTGATPEAALEEARGRVTENPAFEEQVLRVAVLKEWAGERVLTYDQMIADGVEPERWKT